MVSPLASIVSGLGPQATGYENLGQNIQNMELGNQQRQMNQQRMQMNQSAMNQQKRQLTQEDASRQIQFINRLGKQLLNQDESRWPEMLRPHLPALEAMGYTPEVLQGMTRDQVQDVVMQTDSAMQPRQEDAQTASQKERAGLLSDLQSNNEQVRDSAAIGLGLKGRATGAAPQIVMIGGVPYEYDKQKKELVKASVDGTQIDAQVVADDRATIVGAESEAKQRAAAGAKQKEEERVNDKAYKAYKFGMENLTKQLGGTTSGPILGRFPAATTAQQLADSAVSITRPLLKDIFRSAGEGVFTDADQKLLDDLIPKRSQRKEVQLSNLAAIESIVKAKLGIEDAQDISSEIEALELELFGG